MSRKLAAAMVLMAASASPFMLKAQTIVAAPPHTSIVDGFIVTEGDISDRPYTVLGTVSAKAGKATWVSRNPNRTDVDTKLRRNALKMGADAVVRVAYGSTGASAMSWGGVKAEGTAIRYSSPINSQPPSPQR